MADVPLDAPEDCPGTQSTQAGKTTACEGCPNQSICASGLPRAPDPAIEEVRKRMINVKHKILVLSGKGGVGKSTFSAHLSHGLSSDKQRQVALLDIDICGPSIPKIMGCEGEQIHHSNSGWSPIYVEDNLAVMSVGFLLSSPEDAVIWRGPKKNGLIKQFLRDVDWGELDYLVVDTPPGTSDEHLSVVQYLSGTGVDGAVVITTPQEVSLLDVRKEINFCKKVNLPILGVVENMSGFVCPKCKKESKIFPPSTGGGQQLALDTGVPFLGQVPLDPRLGKCCDEGKSYLSEFPESPASKAYNNIISKIVEVCGKSVQQAKEMKISRGLSRKRECSYIGDKVMLVPYSEYHVLKYHEWMQDGELRSLTASEPLSLEDEYRMQESWMNDNNREYTEFLTLLGLCDVCVHSCPWLGNYLVNEIENPHMNEPKATFIILCKEVYNQSDRTERDSMVGDVNLFFNDPANPTVAEIDVMIAEKAHRSKGLGSEAVGLMLDYGISELGVETFLAKIGQENDKSINMFQRKFGFKEVSRSSVFKEITMEMKVDCEARERVESGAEGAHWVPYRQKN